MRISLLENESKYLEAFYDVDLEMVELYWKESSEHMEDHEYQTLTKELLNNVNGRKISNQLLDNRQFLFSMSPALQEWSEKEISSKMFAQNPEVRVAVLTSQDFITQLSIEQAIEEDNNSSDENVRYFEDEQEAKEWLLGL